MSKPANKSLFLFSLAILTILLLAYVSTGINTTKLNEAEVREKFRCDRVTADELATDIYCKNPNYYYNDVENGAVIDVSDFEDPRYKVMHEK